MPGPAYLKACRPPAGPALERYAGPSLRTAAWLAARGSPAARPFTCACRVRPHALRRSHTMLSVPQWPEHGRDVRTPTGTGQRLAARGNGGSDTLLYLYPGFDSGVRHCQGVQYIQTSRTPFQSLRVFCYFVCLRRAQPCNPGCPGTRCLD